MSNIIFLDIDGVLLPNRAMYLPSQTKPFVTVFDPCAVGIVNAICRDTGAKLVIHSSWLRATALVGQHCSPSVDSVKVHMINQGLKADYFHDDHDAKWRFSGTRWNAIYDWLCDHDVDAWVALDDELCPFPDGLMQDFDRGLIIRTNDDVGVDVDHYYAIRSHFGK